MIKETYHRSKIKDKKEIDIFLSIMADKTAAKIIYLVSRSTGIGVEIIASRCAKHDIARARALCYYLLKNTDYSQNQIALLFGKDRDSVANGLRMLSAWCSYDKDILSLRAALLKQISK